MKYRGAVRKNRKGETAVLYTPNTMCGWSTRAATKQQAAAMMFCPEIVDLVLSKTYDTRADVYAKILRLAKKRWPKIDLTSWGLLEHYVLACLEVTWAPKGALVAVTDTENNGCETVNIAYPKTHWET